MIKAIAKMNDGRPMLMLGLSGENMTRLMANEPIQIDVGSLGADLPELVIVLLGGQTEAGIQRDLAPLIGPGTAVRHDG